MMQSFEEIATFVAVVQHGGFGAAADRLGVATPVVSKRVKALEDRLSTQLVQRTPRAFVLTQAGELFYERVQHIPAMIGDAEERVRELSGTVRGRLAVIVPTCFESSAFRERVVTAFLQAYPGVSLTLNVVEKPVDHMRDDFDLLVTGKLPHRQLPETTLVNRRLCKLRGALFAAPSYLEKNGIPRHPGDLTKHNCLISVEREWHFTEPTGRAVVIQAAGSLTTNSPDTLRAAALAGLGIASSFPLFFAGDEQAGRVVRVLDEFTERMEIGVHALYPSSPFVPQRTRAFIDALTAYFAG
jgi:DNA-binding transcriptional LysR family regulator